MAIQFKIFPSCGNFIGLIVEVRVCQEVNERLGSSRQIRVSPKRDNLVPGAYYTQINRHVSVCLVLGVFCDRSTSMNFGSRKREKGNGK